MNHFQINLTSLLKVALVKMKVPCEKERFATFVDKKEKTTNPITSWTFPHFIYLSYFFFVREACHIGLQIGQKKYLRTEEKHAYLASIQPS